MEISVKTYCAGLILIVISLCSCSNEGDQLPQFELRTLDGERIDQNDLQGKITVINVWATWCHNCMNEMDEMNELADKYAKDDAVVLLAVADEEPEVIKSFLKRRDYNFIHVSNGNALTDALQTRLVKTYPQQIVLDQYLKIAFEHTGEMDDAVAELSNQIERLR